MERIKVLHMIAHLHTGGTERQLAQLVKYMNEGDEFLPIVCTFRDGEIRKDIEDAGVRVVIIPKRGRIDPGLIFRLVRFLKAESPQVLNTWLFTANTWGRIAGILAHIPVIVGAERRAQFGKRGFFSRKINKILTHITDIMAVNAHSIKDYLVNIEGINPDKVVVVRNWFDFEKFDEALRRANVSQMRKEFGIGEGDIVVCTVARLAEQKDHATLLKAARIVLDRESRVKFLLVGDGPLREELEALRKSLHLENGVIFAGRREDIPEILAACDIVALSSIREGLPNALIEGMAAGKPIVATNIDGNVELVKDGENGFIVPPKEPQLFAEALLKLVQDEGLRGRMGQAARKFVEENFDRQKAIERLLEVYRELLRKKGVIRQ